MAPGIRSLRPLTIAAFAPALVTVLALPWGFVEEGIAVVAGVYGLYFALPGVVAWCLDVLRRRLPRLVQRILGGVIVAVALGALAFWVLWAAPLVILGAPSATVVLIVGARLLRAAE